MISKYKGRSVGKKILPWLTAIFILVVGYFLFKIFANVNWEEVGAALGRVSWKILSFSVLLVSLNYLVLTFYDYLGFSYIRRTPLEYRKVAPTALVCYAFNFNLGALIGGLAFRVRIYSGWKISKKIIPFVALFTVLTTWVGYTFLLSLVCVLFPDWLDGPFQIPQTGIFLAGLAGLVLVAFYFWLCKSERKVKFKGKEFRFPHVSTAFLQVFLASCQWSLAATIIYLFSWHLGVELSWGKTFYTYLIASIGGVVARIPAGLGVVEALFLKLQPQVPASGLLAAILCFRAVYYILPLILAIPGYLLIELFQKNGSGRSPSSRQNEAAAR